MNLSDSKIQKKNLVSLCIYTLMISALFVFLFGFFPLKHASKLKENRRVVDSKYIQRRYIDKLAFIVIDALRYDFVMPDGNQKYMPFTMSSVLKEEACYLVTKAHSPTVTLPRLKAITSGSVSSYIDVILNFMTPPFEEENFINNAVSNGLKIVFYGDDTWLKLFPQSFIRSEGTNSFFTYDYVEVDNNVSRHIDDELKRDDWDVIILHYLGLDHIGHTEGPNSALVRPKLLEMDDVIKQFNQHFKSLEKTQGLKTMLIVTSDHGMKDSGSHGGVTHAEVSVPLVSLGKPCVLLPGWPLENVPLQIDLAPTLSALFGLSIPANNMGKIIPELLINMKPEEILKHLEINRAELNKFNIPSDEGFQFNSIRDELERWLSSDNRDEETGKRLANKYYQSLNHISEELVMSKSDFKLGFIISGVVSQWILLICLFLEFSKQCPIPKSRIHWFLLGGTALHAFSLLSSSFIEEEHQTWYFLWATFCAFSIMEVFDFKQKNLSIIKKAKHLIPWIAVAVAHRVLRKLNQTGDKWAALPDIKFYLMEEGQPLLLLLFLLGTGMVFCCAVLEKCPVSQLLTYGISLLAVILYRIATPNFKLQYILYPASRGFLETLVFWVLFTLFAVQTAYNRTPFYLVWLAFASLILRPHNVILLPAQVFTSRLLHKLFHRQEEIVWNNLAHAWLGNVFYFYQGNGNSLSNIDVAAGFVGVESYKPVYAGAMIAAHTFNSHILSFILSPKSDLPYAVSRALPLTLYCTTVMFLLNHLFIWSVFSPKLLYDSTISVLLLLLLVFNNLLKFVKAAIR